MQFLNTTYIKLNLIILTFLFSSTVFSDELEDLEEKGNEAIQGVINLLMGISIGMATLMLIGCGIAYMMGGNPEKPKGWAKNVMIGLTFVVCAQLIAKAYFAFFA